MAPARAPSSSSCASGWIESGADVLFTEWNSSSLTAKAVRRGKRRLWLGHLSFVLLHVTDFTHRYENIILPALREGKLVLADRYVFTAFARDVARNADRASVRRLYSFALQPDLALYFRVPLDVAMNAGPDRAGARGPQVLRGRPGPGPEP